MIKARTLKYRIRHIPTDRWGLSEYPYQVEKAFGFWFLTDWEWSNDSKTLEGALTHIREDVAKYIQVQQAQSEGTRDITVTIHPDGTFDINQDS